MRSIVRGDIDGFSGLALDNLVELLLIDSIVCVTGTLAWIAWAIPIDAGMAIVGEHG